MKKIFYLLILSFLLLLMPFVYAEDKPKDWTEYDIAQIAPTQVSEEQFYKYEDAIVHGYSGSGGFFLGADEIEWLKKAVAALEAKGIKLTGEYNRGLVFADSYFHLEDYRKAVEEYRRIGNDGGAEEAEWYLNNHGIENGKVVLSSYPGKIPYTASEETRAEDKQYLFVSYFKGPVYRYDKINDKHAVIWCPPTAYDWSDSLKWDGDKLLISIRDDDRKFTFVNSKSRLYPSTEAKEIVLFPKKSGERIPEDFNHPDLLEAVKERQKEVDAGHWPWRLNPVEYAAVFLGVIYGGHSEEMDAENFPENYPGSVDVKGDNAIVKLDYRGKEHIVYMHKAFPSNPNSIWFVDKVVSLD